MLQNTPLAICLVICVTFSAAQARIQRRGDTTQSRMVFVSAGKTSLGVPDVSGILVGDKVDINDLHNWQTLTVVKITNTGVTAGVLTFAEPIANSYQPGSFHIAADKAAVPPVTNAPTTADSPVVIHVDHLGYDAEMKHVGTAGTVKTDAPTTADSPVVIHVDHLGYDAEMKHVDTAGTAKVSKGSKVAAATGAATLGVAKSSKGSKQAKSEHNGKQAKSADITVGTGKTSKASKASKGTTTTDTKGAKTTLNKGGKASGAMSASDARMQDGQNTIWVGWVCSVVGVAVGIALTVHRMTNRTSQVESEMEPLTTTASYGAMVTGVMAPASPAGHCIKEI